MTTPPLCGFPGPKFLLFSDNVPLIVYYSHLPIIIISLLVGFFVWWKNPRALPNLALFFTTLSFSIWLLLDAVFWASNRSDVIMLVWSLILLIEPLVFIGGLYLLYSIIKRKSPNQFGLIFLGLLYLPLIVLVPTKYSLPAFNLETCLSEEGPIALYYTYFIEATLFIWLVISAGLEYWREKNLIVRKKILLLTLGVIALLLTFVSGNIIGSFTENWVVAQFGLFGMPIFIILFAYLIVRFHLLNIKIIATQALVLALWALIASLVFVAQSLMGLIIASLTLTLAVLSGFALIRSVKREVESRQQLSVANEKLKELDRQKTEFVSIASHQLRAPLTAIKGYSSMLLEGSFGELTEKTTGAVERIKESSERLVNIIEDFLNITRIELGKMKYELIDFDVKKLIEDLLLELQSSLETKGLKLKREIAPSLYLYHGDTGKLRQVFLNLFDNAIKYTPVGEIKVTLVKIDGGIRLTITDTGIGLSKETIGHLFEKFTRSDDAGRTNITGTGLGLYVAKQIVEAHHGKIWAESAGVGQGSTFIVELPV